ncbi:MAG: PfkB family carbohydrate kinase [Fidelibacterota bacterium]
MASHCVVAVGSIALDRLEFSDGTQGETLGGSATYFTLAATLFAPVRLVGIVGTDFPREGMDLLKERAASVDDLQVVEGKTFRWGGRYHADRENRTTLYTELGVFEGFRPRLSPVSRRCPFVFLGNIQPSLQLEVLGQAEHRDRTVVSDTMNLWISRAREDLDRVLKGTDILLINDEEAHLLTGVDDIVASARTIMQMGPRAVVVKRGGQGSLLVDKKEAVKVGAYPVPAVVDPTGAGDSFAGGFVGTLAGGGSLQEAAVAGSAVASYCVEGFGIEGLASVTLEEVKSRMERVRETVTEKT